jgi:hypothetical protein
MCVYLVINKLRRCMPMYVTEEMVESEGKKALINHARCRCRAPIVLSCR